MATFTLSKIRAQLADILMTQLPENPHPLIEKISSGCVNIVGREATKTDADKLNAAIIHGIPQHDPAWEVRRFYLEEDIKIVGLSPVQNVKPVDAVLVALKVQCLDVCLDVCLIELKSSLRSDYDKLGKLGKSTLRDIQSKFNGSISRLSFLLALSEPHNSETVKVTFRGVVFFNVDKTDPRDEADKGIGQLYRILNGQQKALKCSSIPPHPTKIPVKFFKNPQRSDTIEKSFRDLIG